MVDKKYCINILIYRQIKTCTLDRRVTAEPSLRKGDKMTLPFPLLLAEKPHAVKVEARGYSDVLQQNVVSQHQAPNFTYIETDTGGTNDTDQDTDT